jgi:hypothetical protein
MIDDKLLRGAPAIMKAVKLSWPVILRLRRYAGLPVREVDGEFLLDPAELAAWEERRRP